MIQRPIGELRSGRGTIRLRQLTLRCMRSSRSRRAARDTDQALATVRSARSSGLCTLPGSLESHAAAMRGRCVQALAAAASSADAGVRAVALTHPLCHPAWRRRLRSDPDVSLRWAAPVAAAAEMMASDRCATVRDAVASSAHCPAGVLRRLSFSGDAHVVESVAKNPATPTEVLARLGVGDAALRRQVAQNPSAPARTLLVLAEDPDDRIREYVAHNPSTPRDVLVSLASDDEHQVQMGVAANTRAPPETLMKLAVDPGDRTGSHRGPAPPPRRSGRHRRRGGPAPSAAPTR